ncbi:hypothetical protein AMTR_s00155p00067370 [Amborella trichopoda]|uniref:Auxin response factor n=1 Tax=Amborella trichopoda TaxID=13333 RepID=W1PJ02_AMBTC|nr:hypothetical protein AMTR_s00155p00067370 [Amborella trichopoda]
MDPSLGTEVPTKLWRAFAGKTAKVPPLNSLVYYFPQGHAAHASSPPNFSSNTPHSVPCWVSDVQLLGSQHTDEVFAVLKLIPVPFSISENPTPTDFFARAVETDSHAKVLTPSDANNGGGFSVPNACAESVFPRLDKSVEKPAQDLSMRDVHGETWKFRHIYRGSPKRHLLTTGWSAFVNAKMLASEDTVVFARGDDGVVCVALRRRMTAEGQNRLFWLPPEDVVRAAELVASGDQFEVVYYPNRGPAFCVEIHTVDRALNFPWVRGVKIRMTVEGVKGFVNGSVLSALAADRVRWPDSPWELLEIQLNIGTARKKLVGERGPEKELPLRGTPAQSTG